MVETAVEYIDYVDRAVTVVEVYDEVEEFETKNEVEDKLERMCELGYLDVDIVTVDSKSMRQIKRYFPTDKFLRTDNNSIIEEVRI